MINYNIEKGLEHKGIFIIHMLIIDEVCIFQFNLKDTNINYVFGLSNYVDNKKPYAIVEASIYKKRKNLGINVNSEFL